MNQLTIDVNATPKSYEIRIGHHMLQDIAEELVRNPLGKRYALITDSRVAKLHGERLLSVLQEAGLRTQMYVFPAGEEHKNRDTLNFLEDELLKDRYGRDSCVLALGGGVTGDMAGFAAAVYMRGIAYVQIPTTILAQVDSSIGGKTAIDTPQGKNLLGAFYHPRMIFMDMELISTLDDRNYRAGLVELVKHGFIYDASLLDFYRKNETVILGRQGNASYYAVMEELMRRNCQVKNDVVRQDDQESNLRKILNYGHTFGHAVEILSGFRLIHGEAVAVGIRFAALLAERLGLLDAKAVRFQNAILDGLDQPKGVPDGISTDELIRTMNMDKKAKDGKAEFILLDAIGHVYEEGGHYGYRVEPAVLEETIREFTKN